MCPAELPSCPECFSFSFQGTSIRRRVNADIILTKNLEYEKRNKRINKARNTDLWKMWSGSHLADKAGKALQVSPAPLLCK